MRDLLRRAHAAVPCACSFHPDGLGKLGWGLAWLRLDFENVLGPSAFELRPLDTILLDLMPLLILKEDLVHLVLAGWLDRLCSGRSSLSSVKSRILACCLDASSNIGI